MTRTKTFDEDSALESAMLQFWKMGYEATSMCTLEKAMGLNRTSIYNAFGNKRSLYQHSLKRYLESVLARFLAALTQAKTTKEAITDVLHQVVALHFNKSTPGGCMVVLSLMEIHQHDRKTKKLLEAMPRAFRDAIVQRLQQGIEEGELDQGIDPQILGNQLFALINGMTVMAKANFSQKELKQMINISVSTMLY